jgi:rhodanese-related sulfurtransferase
METARRDLLARIDAGTAPAILDVRSRAEFDRGHVPGARHIPFWLLPVRLSSVPASHDDEIVVYCGHRPRAQMAAAVLRRAGFRRVTYLEGDMAGWLTDRLPVQRAGG